MDRLLRAALKPAPRQPEASGPGSGIGCPDAGVLAAFMEGGLAAPEQSGLETHLAGCGRCQEALSVMSDHLAEEPVAEVAAPETRWFTWVTQPRLRWFVPIGAAATVAVVFFATRPLIAPESEDVFLSEVGQMAQAPAPPAELPGAGVESFREKSSQVPEKRPQPAAELEHAAGAAGDSARLVRTLEAGPVTVAAPGGTVQWMFGAGGRISRSADGGASWQPQASGVTGDLLAGSAPTSDVCWIVGAAGTVLLTSDGDEWRRLPFPVAVDLVAVQASDARAATVTTRDGRRFETLDAGLTWSPKQ
ncbi:MAG: YCF48-related protein [Vicinamibacterales bacterium]